ncbi:MAG: BTAD domain-containing putative transcriptional regulator [Mycobacterium sp.]
MAIGPADTPDGAEPSESAVRLEILGPLRLWRGGAELDAGPRQQAYLLALLLAREGRPTSAAELVDLIWGEGAPASALNVLHKYIGALRRLLEPALPVRGTGSHVLRRGSGYLFTAEPGVLDLVDFRRSVTSAKSELARGHHDGALDCYVRALNLWTGPAGDGLDTGPAAMPVFAGLNDEFFDACTAAAELAVSLAQPDRVLLPVQLAAVMAPLHEPVHAALIEVLGAAGRTVEALAVFRTMRTRLAEDLGLDPGPALTTAHERVLSPPSKSASGGRDGETPSASALVGREEELAVLRQAMDAAFAGGQALAIVEGEPGVGKTRLLQEIGAEADRRGATVAWGSCLEGEGTPSMWPWVQVVDAIVATLPSATQESLLGTDLGRLVEPREGILAGSFLPDNGTQFRLFERVVDAVGQVSAQRPLVIVIDDLHWADVASLELFSHLATRLSGSIAIIGALRDRAPSPDAKLARTLAAASRVLAHRRLRLRPLGLAEVAELVRRETGQDADSGAIRGIHTRTAGNPFFVRELSRFLADSGALGAEAAEAAGVPSTVRDVVWDRLDRLDDGVKDVVETAALIGREVGLGLLAAACDLDVQTCLARVEPLQSLGLLHPLPGDQFTFRFTHDLVRESVTGITPPRRKTELHVRIADALERTDPEDDSIAERLAYHLWSAGPFAEPARTASALVRAGSCAATKSALEAAEWQLRSAVRVSRSAGLAELELSALSQLTAVVGMRSMYGRSALDLLERAEHLARGLGRELEAIGFLYSRWAAHAQGVEFDRSGPLARRLLEEGYASSDPIVRAYGLQAWGIHQWDIGNIGESFRYLSQSERTLVANLTRHDEDPVRRDLKLLMTGLLAETSALHGDVDSGRRLLDTLEDAAGDNPYRITVWATIAARIASIVGDPAWALRVAERGIAVDPGFSFVFLGTYQRLARCWGLALTNGDAAAISEAQRLIAANLLDPPRSCVATWYALLGEMHLAVGSIDDAAIALDRADFYLDTYGQRYPEGLLLLLRARLLQAQGQPVAVVRAAAEKARALSADREARLFVRRADQLLAELGVH